MKKFFFALLLSAVFITSTPLFGMLPSEEDEIFSDTSKTYALPVEKFMSFVDFTSKQIEKTEEYKSIILHYSVRVGKRNFNLRYYGPSLDLVKDTQMCQVLTFCWENETSGNKAHFNSNHLIQLITKEHEPYLQHDQKWLTIVNERGREGMRAKHGFALIPVK